MSVDMAVIYFKADVTCILVIKRAHDAVSDSHSFGICSSTEIEYITVDVHFLGRLPMRNGINVSWSGNAALIECSCCRRH